MGLPEVEEVTADGG
jgi:hypothetical protein